MNIRRAAAGASIAALLPFAGAALAQNAPAPATATRSCGARSRSRSSACWCSNASSKSSRKPPRRRRPPRRGSRPAPRVSRSARPTTRTSFACAARCMRTRAPTAANRFRKPPIPSSCGACARPSKARSAASTTSSSCRTSPAAASVIVDAYVAARFNPGRHRHGRQVQAARRPRAPAELGRHPLHRTRAAHQPGPESRYRRAALG